MSIDSSIRPWFLNPNGPRRALFIHSRCVPAPELEGAGQILPGFLENGFDCIPVHWTIRPPLTLLVTSTMRSYLHRSVDN